MMIRSCFAAVPRWQVGISALATVAVLKSLSAAASSALGGPTAWVWLSRNLFTMGAGVANGEPKRYSAGTVRGIPSYGPENWRKELRGRPKV